MVEFVAAAVVFFASHVLPAASGLRTILINRVGHRAYLIAYSLVSLAALGWLVSAATRAPYVELWPPTRMAAILTLLAMLPACILFAAGLSRPNPLSVAFVKSRGRANAPGILAITRHPILWAFLLWAASHVIANGDLIAVLMFGGFALFALAGMSRLQQRAQRNLTASEFISAMSVASGGFAVRLRRVASPRFALEVMCGGLLYVLLLRLHGAVIGVAPLAMLH